MSIIAWVICGIPPSFPKHFDTFPECTISFAVVTDASHCSNNALAQKIHRSQFSTTCHEIMEIYFQLILFVT
jgi:hypothetical protein